MANAPKSFYQFLNEQIIEIPILQRDYAQGRKGKEALRRTFLTSLKKALDDAIASNYGYKPLQLDFVYGSTLPHKESDTNVTLQPLDGQQRLTTLWLLHWYIALRAGKLEEASKTLARFSYETRISSRVFCQKMCISKNFEPFLVELNQYETSLAKAESNPDADNEIENGVEKTKEILKEIKKPRVADFIEVKTWFYTKWKQDPTIQSMLRMLSGDKDETEDQKKRRKNKKDLHIEIDDSIEKIFASTPQGDFAKYWDLLISDNSPIVFYHLPLKKFGLSDDLYVKMNARGKALTPFENFKADLIGYIRKQRENEEFRQKCNSTDEHPSNALPWEKIADPRTGVAILLDTTWANLFWGHRSKNNQIDEAILTFMNRFFWNELFLTGVTLEKNASYVHLNKDNGAVFDDFTPYLYDNGEIPVTFFEDLTTVLNRFEKFNKTIKVPNQKVFNYRPVYIDKEKDGKTIQVVDGITQLGRILFFAVTKYFKEGDYEKVSFDRWIRVVGNLISGVDEDGTQQIRSVEQIRAVIEKISPLDSHNIYENLAGKDLNGEYSKPLDIRFKEEIEKARQILNDDRSGLRDYPQTDRFTTWEEAFKKYETFSFFNGSIRFLYQGENVKDLLWDRFDFKAKNAEAFFSKDNGYYLRLTSKDSLEKTNSYLLKLLYSYTDAKGFWGAMWWRYHVYSNNDSSWLHLLNHPDMAYAVHHLLIEDKPRQYERPTTNEFVAKTLYMLSQTRLLDYIAKKMPNPWIRDYHNHKAIYPSSTGIFLNANFRDDFLQNTENISLATNCKVADTGLLFGSDINFIYKEHNFRWYNSDNIYLTYEIDANCIIRNANGQNDMEKYFMFKAKDIKEKTQIIENLERLISEYHETASA